MTEELKALPPDVANAVFKLPTIFVDQISAFKSQDLLKLGFGEIGLDGVPVTRTVIVMPLRQAAELRDILNKILEERPEDDAG